MTGGSLENAFMEIKSKRICAPARILRRVLDFMTGIQLRLYPRVNESSRRKKAK